MSFERRIASLQMRLSTLMQSVGNKGSTPLSFCTLPNGEKVGIQCHFGTQGARLGFQATGAYNHGDSLQNFTGLLHNGLLDDGSFGGGQLPVCTSNYKNSCSVQVGNGGKLVMFILGTKGQPCRICFAINDKVCAGTDSLENARNCIMYCRKMGFLGL